MLAFQMVDLGPNIHTPAPLSATPSTQTPANPRVRGVDPRFCEVQVSSYMRSAAVKGDFGSLHLQAWTGRSVFGAKEALRSRFQWIFGAKRKGAVSSSFEPIVEWKSRWSCL